MTERLLTSITTKPLNHGASKSKRTRPVNMQIKNKINEHANLLTLLKQDSPQKTKFNPLQAYTGLNFPKHTPPKQKMRISSESSRSVSYNDIKEAGITARVSPAGNEEMTFQHVKEVSLDRFAQRLKSIESHIPKADDIVLQSSQKLIDKVLYSESQMPQSESKAQSNRQTTISKNLAPLSKLPDPRNGASTYKATTNESVGYESEENYLATNESFSNNTGYKPKQDLYGIINPRSPKILVNKKYRDFRKEAEAQRISRLSLPAAVIESYKQANAKLPTIGGKKIFPFVDQAEESGEILMIESIGEKRLTGFAEKISTIINRNGEVFRKERVQKPSEPLVIAGVKKEVRNNDRQKFVKTEKNYIKVSSRTNIDEIASLDTEESDQDLAQENNIKRGLFKFNSNGRLTQQEGSVPRDQGYRFATEEAEENMQSRPELKKEVTRLTKTISSTKPAPGNRIKPVSAVNIKVPNKVKLGSTASISNKLDPVDQVNVKRLEAYRDFLSRMAFSFNIQIRVPEKLITQYKFYIGKGNNHMLIRALMKNRWWWAQTESKNPKEINFKWTQWRNKDFIESLEMKANHELAENNDQSPASKDSNVKGSARNTNGLDGIVTDFHKRLFTQKERELMEKCPDAFRLGSSSKQYEDLGRKKGDFNLNNAADSHETRMCNHIEDNFHLSNKKALLMNMRNYYASIGDDVFRHLPLTFHIKDGLEDEEFKRFLECYKQREKEIQEQETEEKGKGTKKQRNLWIVKPGEDTNKGKGISMVNDLEEIKSIVGVKTQNAERTHLIQLYLDRPLLYNKRKFDIRCYMLISCINGVYKGYWYQEGYFRTSSKEFTVKNMNKQIHLTNDAIQKKYEEYGKWESGNKVSYSEFERYLENTYGGTVDFYKNIYPQMKQSATDTIKAVYGIVDPHKRENTFEVFGLDFMIDANFKVWLIEVNTNPDITIPTPKLGILIPNMVENALRLTIDVLFPPPIEIPSKKQTIPENLLENNKFELVFDEAEDSHVLKKTLKDRQEALKNFVSGDQDGEEESEEDCKD